MWVKYLALCLAQSENQIKVKFLKDRNCIIYSLLFPVPWPMLSPEKVSNKYFVNQYVNNCIIN